MPNDRTEGRRADRRAFRPTLDGRLEARLAAVAPGATATGAAHVGPVKLFTANVASPCASSPPMPTVSS
jgi:hypothetical protein